MELEEGEERIEIRGLDRAAAEGLGLELRRLARRYGIDISDFRIEKAGSDATDASRSP